MTPNVVGGPTLPRLSNNNNIANTFPFPGATMDMWFSQGQYVGRKAPSDITYTRGQNLTATNITFYSSPGTPIIQYAANTMRIIPGYGFLREAGPHTNYFTGNPISPASGVTTTSTLAAGNYTAWCNSDSGVTIQLVGTTSSNVTGLTNIAQGSYCSFSVIGAAGSAIQVTIPSSGAGTNTYGMQIENNTWPTSLIALSCGIRGSENCQITISPCSTNGSGTYYASYVPTAPNNVNTNPEIIWGPDNGTNTSRAVIFRRPTGGNSIARGTVDANADIGLTTAVWLGNVRGRLAMSVAAGQQFECYNGGVVSAANYGLPSAGTSNAWIGQSFSANVVPAYGYIERISYFPAPLSASQVQSLTKLS